MIQKIIKNKMMTPLFSDFIKLQPLKNEIHHIQMQQNVILILLIVLLVITAGHFSWKLIKWLKQKRCWGQVMQKLKLKKEAAHPATLSNGKDFAATTIPNLNAINDIERAPSQIYSLTGKMQHKADVEVSQLVKMS